METEIKHEGINRSSSIGNLAKAFLAFQSKVRFVKKSAANPFFKSSYADFGAIIEACRDEMLSNGLVLIQSPGQNSKGDLCVDTLIVHSSGEWIEGRIVMHPVKLDPQSTGSAITYARRYALQAMLGIAAEEDDDGGRASAPHSKPKLPEGAYQEVLSDEEKTHIKASAEMLPGILEKLSAAKNKKEVEALGVEFGSSKEKLTIADLDVARAAYAEALNRVKK